MPLEEFLADGLHELKEVLVLGQGASLDLLGERLVVELHAPRTGRCVHEGPSAFTVDIVLEARVERDNPRFRAPNHLSRFRVFFGIEFGPGDAQPLQQFRTQAFTIVDGGYNIGAGRVKVEFKAVQGRGAGNDFADPEIVEKTARCTHGLTNYLLPATTKVGNMPPPADTLITDDTETRVRQPP